LDSLWRRELNRRGSKNSRCQSRPRPRIKSTTWTAIRHASRGSGSAPGGTPRRRDGAVDNAGRL